MFILLKNVKNSVIELYATLMLLVDGQHDRGIFFNSYFSAAKTFVTIVNSILVFGFHSFTYIAQRETLQMVLNRPFK